MADNARALAKMVRRFHRMSAADQRRVLDHLTPPERVALQRHVEPERDPETLLSQIWAERIEMLRDGEVPEVTTAGRKAILDLAAKPGLPSHATASLSERQSLTGRVAGAVGSLVK